MRAATLKKYKNHSKNADAFGGDLLKTRLGRSTPRPLSTVFSMHFVVRSTQARGAKSFRRPENFSLIHAVLDKFGEKHHVKVNRASINLNHIHLSLEIRDRVQYKRFIRAVTAAIAMAVGGLKKGAPGLGKFWDRRPFSRIVRGPLEGANLMDYFDVNDLEAIGYSRKVARRMIQENRHINNALRVERPG